VNNLLRNSKGSSLKAAAVDQLFKEKVELRIVLLVAHNFDMLQKNTAVVRIVKGYSGSCFRTRIISEFFGLGVNRSIPSLDIPHSTFCKFPHHAHQVRHRDWTTPLLCANLLPYWARPEGPSTKGENCDQAFSRSAEES